MPTRKLKKPSEGKRLPDTPDMLAWRKEFEELDLEAHKQRLKALGLDDEELEEFEEMEKEGVPLDEEIMHEGPAEEIEKKVVKKAIKKKTKKK
jgi:hypothetical protein